MPAITIKLQLDDTLEDLVVGNAGDGELALFEGGPGGLSLTAAATEANLPDPTALAFSALTGGQVQFYAATAGRESAELVALSLGIESGTSSAADASFATSSVAQLVPLSESSLPLVATVLTFTSRSGSNPAPSAGVPDRTANPGPGADVDAIDAIIQSVWGEERCSACRQRLSNTERPSAGSHDVLPPVRLIDWLSPRSLPLNRIQFSSDRRNRAGLPLCFETGNDEPDLTLTSLIAATVATEWLLAWRWDRTRRSGRSGAPMDSGIPVAPFHGAARGHRLYERLC